LLDPNNIEDLKSLNKSREITKEILNFGVSQDEIIKIIKLLSFELENTELMKKIIDVVEEKNNKLKESKEKNIIL